MTQFMVIRGERTVQFTAECNYQIHSVFETGVDPNIQLQAFTADFLNFRKGVNQWEPDNWYSNYKYLTLATPIDGEREEWCKVPVIEHRYRSCFYCFITQQCFT